MWRMSLTSIPRDERAKALPSRPIGRHRRWAGPAVAVGFLLGAVFVTAGLWIDPAGRVSADNSADQFFFEWVLTYTAHAITHGANPFFTSAMNAPLGVNLATNTSITLIGVILSPITLLFGAAYTYVVTLTLGISLTAYAWYWVLYHKAGTSRGAAILAGAFCGFAPGVMAHANAHINFTAQFVLPILIWRLVRLTRTVATDRRTTLRDGVIVGVLAAVQYTIGAEMLFFTGLAVGVYAIAWSIPRRRVAARIARRIAARLAVALGVVIALDSYPLWIQFFGPQAYHGTGFFDVTASENLLSLIALRNRTIGGTIQHWPQFALNVAEQNTYFGPVLFVLVVVALVRLSRRGSQSRLLPPTSARPLAITAIVIVLLALGPRLRVGTTNTHFRLPWALLHDLPLFDSALPGRLALLLIPIIGYVLAVCFDELRRIPARRGVVLAVAVLALVPIVPLPIATGDRSALPRFFTSGEWRAYVPDGRTVVSIPASTSATPDAQRWQTATDFAFPINGGYFLGPGPIGRSHVGPNATPTYAMFKAVSATGDVPVITDKERAQARADLAYWRAGLIVLADPRPGIGDQYAKHYDALRQMAEELFGPGRRVDDVEIWTP